MASANSDINIPDELLDKLQNFHHNFEQMTDILKPLCRINVNSTDYQLNPLDRARLNLISGYALNSLFWMYLNTLGIDAKDHKIKKELERYRYFMSQIKEAADKDKAPVINKEAAGRFIRNALWEPKDSQNEASSLNQADVQPKRMRQERDRMPQKQKYQSNKKRRY